MELETSLVNFTRANRGELKAVPTEWSIHCVSVA